MTNILVTGGSGRLASYVTPRLRDAGHHVTNFDAVAPPNADDPAPFILGDLTSLEDCMRALTYSDAEVIVHLGALAGPTEMIKRPRWRSQQSSPEDLTMRVNTMGTYHLLDAARRLGSVRQVIFASSFYTLGLGNRISDRSFQVDYLPIDEDHPLRPEDSYGLSKVFGEEMLRAHARAWGITAVAFRLLGVSYPNGEGFPYEFDVNPAPKPDHIGGPINTTYQYVDARDVANACVLAIQAPELDEFEAFYLSTDTQYSEATVDLVARVWPELAPMAKDIEGTDGIVSDAKVRQKLGYLPEHSWRNQ